jgi:hypothetical protein
LVIAWVLANLLRAIFAGSKSGEYRSASGGAGGKFRSSLIGSDYCGYCLLAGVPIVPSCPAQRLVASGFVGAGTRNAQQSPRLSAEYFYRRIDIAGFWRESCAGS